MITIYDDGIFNNSRLMMTLQSFYDVPITFCTSSMIIDGYLDKQTLLIMPGGADLYFCEKLNDIGNQRIRDFVKNGGSYLGICAGAYYACSQLDWGCGEITGTRELDFYNGKSTGPVYEWVENSESIYNGSWIKAAEIERSDGHKFLTQYNGGPVFENIDGSNVIARYKGLESNPPAIVQGNFGEGKYILSSPHIEKFGHSLSDGLYKHLNNSYEWEKKEIDALLQYTEQQKDFFKEIVDRLL
jgi:glutamine amidotransferase-like uncharacterized protein